MYHQHETEFDPSAGDEMAREGSVGAALDAQLPRVDADISADDKGQGPAEQPRGDGNAASTGKIPRVSSLGSSPTPHVAHGVQEAAEQRDHMREPVHTTASDVAAPADVRWPGSKPPR